jgi:hypothetical protein
MLEVVVCLEQGVAGEELDQDAAYTPNVAGKAPTEIEYNLWCTVVTSRHDRGVILVVERSGTEVDKPYFRVEEHLAMSRTAADSRRRRRYGSVVCKRLVVVVDEQNVLRLQIGMDQIEVVQKGDAGEELLRKLLDMRAGEWHKAVGLEEVEHALPVQVGDDADVVPEVEAVPQMDTPVYVVLVVRSKC